MMKYQLHLNEEKCLEILSFVTGFQPSRKDCTFFHGAFYSFFRFCFGSNTYVCYIFNLEPDKAPVFILHALNFDWCERYDLNVPWMLLHDMLREVAA